MTAVTWDELTSGLRYSFIQRASFLIERGYRHDITVEQLAEEIYNKERDKIEKRVSQFVAKLIQ